MTSDSEPLTKLNTGSRKKLLRRKIQTGKSKLRQRKVMVRRAKMSRSILERVDLKRLIAKLNDRRKKRGSKDFHRAFTRSRSRRRTLLVYGQRNEWYSQQANQA
jgi:hypothetical protein